MASTATSGPTDAILLNDSPNSPRSYGSEEQPAFPASVPLSENGPGAESEDASKPLPAHEWVQYFDSDSLCRYWHNVVTGETTWDEPQTGYDVDASAADILAQMSPDARGTRSPLTVRKTRGLRSPGFSSPIPPITSFTASSTSHRDVKRGGGGGGNNTAREGFICPTCMTDFGSAQNLMNHSRVCRDKFSAKSAPKSTAPKPPARIPGPEPVVSTSTSPQARVRDIPSPRYSERRRRPTSFSDKIFQFFGAKDPESTPVASPVPGSSSRAALSDRQVKRLLSVTRRNRALKKKLSEQTEKYTNHIIQLVDRDRKYKILLKKRDEQHAMALRGLRNQNARLARGIEEQRREFEMDRLKLTKQNQGLAKELSGALARAEEEAQACGEAKRLCGENSVLRETIQKLKIEVWVDVRSLESPGYPPIPR